MLLKWPNLHNLFRFVIHFCLVGTYIFTCYIGSTISPIFMHEWLSMACLGGNFFFSLLPYWGVERRVVVVYIVGTWIIQSLTDFVYGHLWADTTYLPFSQLSQDIVENICFRFELYPGADIDSYMKTHSDKTNMYVSVQNYLHMYYYCINCTVKYIYWNLFWPQFNHIHAL